jgi:putative N6-adenine-specific DNA methylase
MKILVKTFHGLEDVLAKELQDLGAKNIEKLNRAVQCEGDQTILYRANYELRTALRVLVHLHSFTAFNEKQLYQKVYAYNWIKHLKLNQTFAIDSVVNSDQFRHSKFVALKTKDAIVDQFRSKFNKRPSIDIDYADIRFNVFCNKTDFSLYLDSSGDSLHKRGYRLSGHQAPLNEVLAAGMILLSEWDKEKAFLDLMCGTGTILMEACMLATKTPPGLKRNAYSFQQWPDYNKSLFHEIVEEAKAKISKTSAPIIGGDSSRKALEICEESIQKFNYQDLIQVKKQPFQSFKNEFDEGLLIMNPPYGERLGQTEQINTLYALIGDHLKRDFSGFEAWIISSNFQAFKHVGLRPSKKIVLFNGPLECKFQKYTMYSGSKKASKQMNN